MSHKIADQCFHIYKNACIVGSGRKYQMTPAECGCNDIRCRCNRYIVHYSPDTFVTQFACQNLCRILRMSVNRSIGNHYAVLFRRIGTPVHVFFHVITDILSPDKSMKRADHLDIQRRRLLQKCLYLVAVFSDDIGIISSGFVHIIMYKIHLICKKRSVQCTKGTKCIG